MASNFTHPKQYRTTEKSTFRVIRIIFAIGIEKCGEIASKYPNLVVT
jgi:hypothetical protein